MGPELTVIWVLGSVLGPTVINTVKLMFANLSDRQNSLTAKLASQIMHQKPTTNIIRSPLRSTLTPRQFKHDIRM